MYFLAVGHYKLGNYPEAKRYNSASSSFRAPSVCLSDTLSVGMLLEKEPNNFQAQSLNALIEQAVSKGELRDHPFLAMRFQRDAYHLAHSPQSPSAEGYVGMAIAGGVAAAAGILFTALMTSRGRR